MTIHKFGKRQDGRLIAFFGTLDDREFEEVTRNGLPQGWVAWHVEESECDEPISERVQKVRELPHFEIPWRDAWINDRGPELSKHRG